MPRDDLEHDLLRQLLKEPAASQRSLASRLGVSVGKVNYCMKALIDKGWVKANNFRRSDNKWAYAYLLTPAGIDAKARMTQRFLKIKVAEYARLQLEIETLRQEAEQ